MQVVSERDRNAASTRQTASGREDSLTLDSQFFNVVNVRTILCRRPWKGSLIDAPVSCRAPHGCGPSRLSNPAGHGKGVGLQRTWRGEEIGRFRGAKPARGLATGRRAGDTGWLAHWGPQGADGENARRGRSGNTMTYSTVI